MKTYNNGPRKGMMYGGMSRRKPMMYGGTAMKKPRKKAYGGGMMSSSQPQQNMMQNNTMTSGDMNQMQTAMMQTPKLRMAKGGLARGIKATKKQQTKTNKTDRQLLAESDPTRPSSTGMSKELFGRLSIKAGIDKNPRPTKADRIAGARMKKQEYSKKR